MPLALSCTSRALAEIASDCSGMKAVIQYLSVTPSHPPLDGQSVSPFFFHAL